MKKLLLGLVASLVGVGSAFAHATLAAWENGFSVLTKDGVTIDLQGNAVSDDGAITIGSTAGVKISGPVDLAPSTGNARTADESALTVLVELSDIPKGGASDDWFALATTIIDNRASMAFESNGGKFALFSANDGNFKAAFSVYSFKAWKDNIPALDLVPAYKASSDEAGLYDFVNDVFYASGGSKAFARQATLAEPLLEQKGGKLVATVPVLDADQSASLFAGATYGGTNEWGDAIQTVTVPAGETEAAFDLPSGWGETVWYARAKVRDGESAIWTKSLVADDAALPSATLAFAHRTSIVFDGYAGEETLCDFPALVRVGEGSGGFSYAQCVAGGGRDVRFTLADGVELPSEVAEWNPQGESAFWVRLPVLKGRNTRVVMHWGAANPPARELAGSVWSEDYNGVWSFEDEKRALRDSTRRGQHGIASFDSDRSEGVVGKARTFSYNASALGSSGYALAGHAHDDVQFKAKVITWECWYRRTGSLDGKSHVLMKTFADGQYKGVRVIIGDTGLASEQYDSTAVSGLPSAALDEWHHVMMSVDGV